jgi:ornithine cyclodeaminase/alanine dehydrogenase-like protein (mu-crystallin family)
VFATWSREPLASLADTRPGQHLTSLGTDEPGKRELAGDILGSATVVVDDLRLARSMGALWPLGQRPVEAATLGQVLRGEHPGRSRPDELTVYAPAGLPWQDLAIAWQVYQAARKRGRGVRVDLLA